MTHPDDFAAFRQLSAALGQDPLRVQGAGGNTSLKQDGTMWIKASGTELAHAEHQDIFVAVDRDAARAEAHGAGDGTCKATVLDPAVTLRPSIETTFHAVFRLARGGAYAFHCHAGPCRRARRPRPAGREALGPALGVGPLRQARPASDRSASSRKRTPATRVVVLENHGLICVGDTVEEVTELIETVEARLHMPARDAQLQPRWPTRPRASPGPMKAGSRRTALPPTVPRPAAITPIMSCSSGLLLPEADHAGAPPAILMRGQGIALRDGATPAQRAMLRCLADLLARVPGDWPLEVIGPDAEAELLDWDAEKYRQALAARS